jgi:hypothetical protein
MVEPVYQHPRARHTCAFPNHRIEASSPVGHHGSERYLCLFITMQSSKMTYLSVEQSWAQSLLAKVKQGEGTSYVDEAIDLDYEGTTCLFCRHSEQ